MIPMALSVPRTEPAPSPVSALIHAATMVNAGVYVLARFYPAYADFEPLKKDAYFRRARIDAGV
mgnify:CR=1 FL=1